MSQLVPEVGEMHSSQKVTLTGQVAQVFAAPRAIHSHTAQVLGLPHGRHAHPPRTRGHPSLGCGGLDRVRDEAHASLAHSVPRLAGSSRRCGDSPRRFDGLAATGGDSDGAYGAPNTVGPDPARAPMSRTKFSMAHRHLGMTRRHLAPTQPRSCPCQPTLPVPCHGVRRVGQVLADPDQGAAGLPRVGSGSAQGRDDPSRVLSNPPKPLAMGQTGPFPCVLPLCGPWGAGFTRKMSVSKESE